MEKVEGRPLSTQEQELICVCVHYARMLMLPKSVGQVYGILFAVEESLCLDDIHNLLKISKGAVSQGLQVLRDLGAVEVQKVEGDRRDYYRPVLSLRTILSGVFQNRLEPDFARGREMIQKLATGEAAESDFLKKRIGSMRAWANRANLPLNLLSKLVR